MPQAMICDNFGPVENLRLAAVPYCPPEPGQVVVDIRAIGLNFPEALTIEGRYQTKPALPFIPGNEASGVVREVGGAVTRFKPGDAVVVRSGGGAYASEVTLAEASVFAMPAGLDFRSAAAFTTGYGTAYYALVDVGAVKSGETVLVLGAAGGVGLAAVDIARMLGAKVIAAASSDEKLAACSEHGASTLINYDREDLRTRLKEIAPDGFDIVVDPVGGRYSEPAFRGLGWKGRHLVIGFAAGDIPKIALNLPLVKGSSIHGVWWGQLGKRDPQRQREIILTVATAIGAGQLRPRVSGSYRLADAGKALRDILDRKAVGKLVLTVG